MADQPDLVQRRRQYIERQIALDNGTVNVTFRQPEISTDTWTLDCYS